MIDGLENGKSKSIPASRCDGQLLRLEDTVYQTVGRFRSVIDVDAAVLSDRA